MVYTVKVHNVSLRASEQDIKEFFCFSGEIIYVEMQSCDERSQFAYITFKEDQDAERAMLLTGATIVDMSVIITSAINYQLPAAVLAELESKNSSGIVDIALRKAEDVVISMLARGFVLGKDALEKAKVFDKTHQLTSTATAKVYTIDKSLGLSEKMKEVDQKYQVADKTMSALAAAEHTIMSNRYVLTGAAWVTNAYHKVEAKSKEGQVAEQDAKNQDSELGKSHLHESSKEAGQECERQEGGPAKVHIPETTEMDQIAEQKAKHREVGIATDHAQENAEAGEKMHKNQETELPKADKPESLLMAGHAEEEHKQTESEFAKNDTQGGPVTIAVCTGSTDGNPSNTPEKPEAA